MALLQAYLLKPKHENYLRVLTKLEEITMLSI